MLYLEPFSLDDFEPLNRWIRTEQELVQFSGSIFTFPLTLDQVNDYLGDPKRTVFRVALCPSGPIIGMAELYNLSEDTDKIARVLIGDPSVRGQGLGAMLIQHLVDYAFHQHHKPFVVLNVYDWNVSAIRCYTKVGFQPTQRAPKISRVQGQIWNAIEMRLSLKKE